MRRTPQVLTPLARALEQPAAGHAVVAERPGRGARQAAVLALFATWPELSVVVIERAATMRSHAGQLAFPGGAVDPEDSSTEAAALREAAEEIGLDGRGVDLLGRLPAAHVAVSGFDVSTVVGWWREPHRVEPVDLAEVAAVHVLGVEVLLDPANRLTCRHPSGYRGPAFEVDDLFIWGLTGGLLDGLFRLAGWEKPWNRGRLGEIPSRFLRDRSRRESGTSPDVH